MIKAAAQKHKYDFDAAFGKSKQYTIHFEDKSQVFSICSDVALLFTEFTDIRKIKERDLVLSTHIIIYYLENTVLDAINVNRIKKCCNTIFDFISACNDESDLQLQALENIFKEQVHHQLQPNKKNLVALNENTYIPRSSTQQVLHEISYVQYNI